MPRLLVFPAAFIVGICSSEGTTFMEYQGFDNIENLQDPETRRDIFSRMIHNIEWTGSPIYLSQLKFL
ncbi:MAG: hypothetical protein LBJ89_01375 [Holosporales bacterium]|jgi:hypothetical protein|nr:hypothetical protein [Holosporales bacterium]